MKTRLETTFNNIISETTTLYLISLENIKLQLLSVYYQYFYMYTFFRWNWYTSFLFSRTFHLITFEPYIVNTGNKGNNCHFFLLQTHTFLIVITVIFTTFIFLSHFFFHLKNVTFEMKSFEISLFRSKIIQLLIFFIHISSLNNVGIVWDEINGKDTHTHTHMFKKYSRILFSSTD